MKIDNYSFYIALRKYGWYNFEWEVLEEMKNNYLNEREIYYINKFDTYNNGYNMTKGGDINPMKNPEIVKKMAITKTGKRHTEKTKRKISKSCSKEKNGFYGKTHTEETLIKMRTPKSEEHKRKIGKANSKYWLLENIETGIKITIRNLSKFCKEKNLHYGSMKASAKMYGKYKEWRIEQC